MKITIELEKDRNINVDVKLGKDSERKGFTPVREYTHNGTPLKDTPGMAEIRCRAIKEKRILKKLEEE